MISANESQAHNLKSNQGKAHPESGFQIFNLMQFGDNMRSFYCTVKIPFYITV